jgi:hypothetical protein
MTLLFLSALLTTAVLSNPAAAWGPDGHRMIGELAMRNLPPDLPDFLRSAEAATLVGYLSPEPDRERGAGESFDADRSPAHFIDVSDDLSIMGGPMLSALPPSREAFDTALRAAGTDQYKTGYLPYSIADGFELVAMDLAYWRIDAAGEKNAKSQQEHDWFAKNRIVREQIVLHDIGLWSHFVGDGSQPMHASVHYNGWGDFPNPEGFTQDHVHIPFENQYVHDNVSEDAVAAAMTPTSSCADPILTCTASYLAGTQQLVVPFYRLQKQGAFAEPTPQGIGFAATQIARGASELRDLVADAWRDSDTKKIGYPPVPVTDFESGKADAYATLNY